MSSFNSPIKILKYCVTVPREGTGVRSQEPGARREAPLHHAMRVPLGPFLNLFWTPRSSFVKQG